MKVTIEGDAKEIAELLTTIRLKNINVEVINTEKITGSKVDAEIQSERVFVSTPPLAFFEQTIPAEATTL